MSIIYKINANRDSAILVKFSFQTLHYIMIYKGKYVFYSFVDLAQSASKYI